MNYRIATEQDIPAMCRIRKQQLIDEGSFPDTEIDSELNRYFADRLADGSLVEWLAEEDGEIVATAAIVFMEFPPAFTNVKGIRGYVANMYTAPGHRRKGIATGMLDRLMDEAKKRSVHKIFLIASIYGKPVYKQFGFVEGNKWMELDL